MRARRGSLRFRIVATFVAWVIALDVLLVLVVPAVREHFTLGFMKTRVTAEALTVGELIASGEIRADELILKSELSQRIGLGGSGRLWYQVTAMDGAPIATSGFLKDVAHLPTRALDTPFARPGVTAPVFQTIRTEATASYPPDIKPGPARLGIATCRVLSADGVNYNLLVAGYLQSADWFRGLLTFLLLGALVPGIIFAALAGWFVASSITRRLEQVTAAVRAVSPTRMHERIALPASDDEIGRMAGDVNAMLDRIATTYRGMERYIAEVSHELRTPVASLLAEAQVLKRSAKDQSPGTAAFVDSVEEEMRRLSRLIDSFLTLARFEHGTAFLARGLVNLNDAAVESVQHSSRFARRADVSISLHLFEPADSDGEPVVRGDGELIRIAIDNILRNAVQFSPPGSSVDLHVAKADSNATVSVRDRGPGIPPEFIPRIFERFVQAPTRTASRGLGLGLAIAKAVIDVHRGSIDATNHPGGGCVFSIRLPTAASHLPTPRPMPATPA